MKAEVERARSLRDAAGAESLYAPAVCLRTSVLPWGSMLGTLEWVPMRVGFPTEEDG